MNMAMLMTDINIKVTSEGASFVQQYILKKGLKNIKKEGQQQQQNNYINYTNATDSTQWIYQKLTL